MKEIKPGGPVPRGPYAVVDGPRRREVYGGPEFRPPLSRRERARAVWAWVWRWGLVAVAVLVARVLR